MKKIFILISLLYNILLALAQTNYYAVTKTFNEQGYTYQCDVSGGRNVTLYNKNNKWTYVNQMKKGTNTPFYVTPENYSPLYVKDKNEAYNDSIFKVIVNNAFADYKGKMKGSKLTIITCTDSETGKISEVLFNFAGFTPYATIPVSIYREIETKLIGLKYTLTPLAKTLNYVYQWWAIEPK
ncbi:DUF5043 domain-containing protein [Bacteroides thetaiotaomicron]|uniref:DUF5043 domain-containing protein n=1 Tax=Bacteroides thetaiotaomicron TaxID=818 RepID=UPI002165DA9E|nr:DUF5043 domain-containing protein [Bacteroides thetaiotaomicron]MCS3194510.1 DUF5043 domain-containing protein [Bacteroides thetaiotaomicron]